MHHIPREDGRLKGGGVGARSSVLLSTNRDEEVSMADDLEVLRMFWDYDVRLRRTIVDMI